MTGKTDWEGTATALLDALAPFAGDAVRRRDEWPLPNKLRGKLREVAAPLRKLGITYKHNRAGDAAGTRMIYIEKRERNIAPKSQPKGSSEPSPSSEKLKPAVDLFSLEPRSGSSEVRKRPRRSDGTASNGANGTDHSSDAADGSDDPLAQEFGAASRSSSGASRADLIRQFAAENPKRSPAWVARNLGQPEALVREALGIPPKTAKKASDGEVSS